MKQVIVNADDFGLSAGINRGILYGHQRGIITSTSVMINGADAPAGLDAALKDAPDLGIGLHVNLTRGRPVSPPDRVRSLVDENGLFFSIQPWFARLDMFDPEHIEREIAAQFQQFTRLTGKLPDHLDSHHHVTYLHPAAFQAALRLAQEHNLPLRGTGLDLPPQDAIQVLSGIVPDLTPEAARGVIERLKTMAGANLAPYCPARLETGFTGRHSTLGGLLVILTTLPEDAVTEIICHPGYADAEKSHAWREIELGHLTHAATLECVRSEGIQRLTFGDTLHDPRLFSQ